MSTPKISILLPVYNGEKFLKEAVDSILQQSFEDFEFIIIDDCSTDSSLSILQSFRDPRLNIKKCDPHKGISHNLNWGIQSARGTYIARMDCDDISRYTRLEEQYDFMENNKNVMLSGTKTEVIDEEGKTKYFRDSKINDSEIKITLLCGETSLAHPTAIMRKVAIERYNLWYDPIFDTAEDYELWCRFSMHTKMENLSNPLHCHREHNHSVSSLFFLHQRHVARKAVALHLSRLGIEYNENELACHFQLSLPLDEPIDETFYKEISNWIKKLLSINERKRWFAPDIFHFELHKRLQQILKRMLSEYKK